MTCFLLINFPRHGSRNEFNFTISSEAIMSSNIWIWKLVVLLTEEHSRSWKKKKNWHGKREVYAYAKTQSFFTWRKQLAIGMTKELGTRWGASSQWKYVSYEKVELIDLEEYTNILIFYSKVLVIWFILIHIYSFDEMFFSLLLYFWMLHLFFFSLWKL